MQEAASGHAILTRIADDTNLWLAPPQPDNVIVEGLPAKKHQGKSKQKCHQLMAFLQRLSIRSSASDTLQTVQIHTPAQVLPKARAVFVCTPFLLKIPLNPATPTSVAQANAATLNERMRHLAVLHSGKSSELLGGPSLNTALRAYPLRAVVTCAALRYNCSVHMCLCACVHVSVTPRVRACMSHVRHRLSSGQCGRPRHGTAAASIWRGRPDWLHLLFLHTPSRMLGFQADHTCPARHRIRRFFRKNYLTDVET